MHVPGGDLIMQVGRNLLDAVDGFLLRKTHLILDRDPVFTDQFRRLLKDSGVQPLRLPQGAPVSTPTLRGLWALYAGSASTASWCWARGICAGS